MNHTIIGTIIFTTLLSLSLNANDITDYAQGLQYYKNNQIKKAFPIIEKEAQKGNKEAQYLLASFYEKGLGVKQDIQKALFWYKESSSSFAYITEPQKVTEKKKVETKTDQNLDESNQHSLQFIFSKLDLSSQNVKEEVDKIVNKDFGLMPYHSNYILPFSYSTKKYLIHNSNIQNSNEEYPSNVESEFQLSVQKNLWYNRLGFNEYLTFGYTQHAWWQCYTDSAPFRETNYTPELFITVPTSYDFDKLSNLKAVRFGFRHQSNGQSGYQSRSWNRLYLSTFWQWDKIFLRLEGWYRIPEKKKGAGFYNGTDINDRGDDNPDIEKYLGYGDMEIRYLYGSQQFGLKLRNNLRAENKGSAEVDWSIPINNAQNTYWYMKAFNGYGESLIDYDRSTTKLSFGFSFFRNLF